MSSTYSNLKIELIGTGDQTGSWGLTTNTNLGTAIEEAIVGSADVTFASGDVTVTLTDTNATQTARNLRLNLTGTSGGARNLILGSGCQIEKPYLINNGLADAVTVKNTTGTGITVPAGKSMWVYNNGTNVVDAVTHLSSLTLGSPLPITSGGTGTSSTTFVNLATNVTGTLPVGNGGTGTTVATAGGVVYGTGTQYALTPAGTAGYFLQSQGAGAPVWAVAGTGDVIASINNAFTGANTFYNATGQTFAQATTNDGIRIQGRAGGSSSYRLTFTTGTLASSRTVTFPDGGGNYTLGYINIPPVGTKTSSYTLAAGDVGKYVQIGSGGSIIIPAFIFSEGDAILLFNNTSSGVTITCSAITTYISGTDTVRTSMTLTTRGTATILYTSSSSCVVTGSVS